MSQNKKPQQQKGPKGDHKKNGAGGQQKKQSGERQHIEHAWDKKFKDEVVDYFGGDKEDNQMFNKMPVLKENNRVMKAGKKSKGLKQKNEMLDSDEEFERMMMGSTGNKKQKSDENDDVFGGQEGLFAPLSSSFANFFVTNKYALLQLQKVPVLRYSVGTQALASISEFGTAGQYMIANMTRNKKAFITIPDAAEVTNEENDLRVYDQGEFLVGEIVPSVKEGNLNMSVKASKLNNGLAISDIQDNMVLQGVVKSKEEHGAKIELHGGEQYFGFLPRDAATDFEYLEEGRVYLFRVTKKEEKKRLLQLSMVLYQQEEPQQLAVNLDGAEEQADLHHLAKPGNLVNCIVLKSLSNGLIVRFLKNFIGFVFEDHLEKDVSAYREKEKILGRIIASDFEQKQINISFKKVHLELKPFQDDSVVVGDVLSTGYEVTKVLFGGSFYVRPLNASNKSDASLSTLFLHKTHASTEEMKEGEIRKESLKIKEINFFEQMGVVTAKGELVKKVCGWNDLRAGQVLTGKIDKIISGSAGQFKVKVQIGERVTGLVDFYNTSDVPKAGAGIPKQLKEGRRVKVRVLNVHPQEKQLRLTMKQTLIEEEESKIMKSASDAVVGETYHGILSKKTEYGFIVQFFGDAIGLLTFKDIEEINKRKRDEFKVGSTIKVSVVFVHADEGKIGLSLSEKGLQYSLQQKAVINTSRNTLFKMEALNVAVEQITQNVGDVVEYTVEPHQAFTDILTLSHSDHRAMIAVEQLSDFKEHCQSLNQLYRAQANKGLDVKISCKIIQVSPNKNVIVSSKSSILSEYNPNSLESVKPGQIYSGYIDRGARKGVLVKFNERVKLFIGSESLDSHTYQTYDSVLVFVKSVEGDKINGSILAESVLKKPLENLHLLSIWLKEEAVLNKQYLAVDQSKKLFNKYRVGDYVNTNIQLVKEFGVVVQVSDSTLTGLIMNEHVANIRNKLIEGQNLLCRIIDVDFEKQMLDLIPAQIEDNVKMQSVLYNHTFNIDKLLALEVHDSAELSVLCQKGSYAICNLVKAPKVICLVNMSNFNGVSHEEMLFGQRIKGARLTNKPELIKAQKSPQAVQVANLGSYVPLFEQPFSSNNTKHADNDKGVVLRAGIKVVGKVLKIVGLNAFIQLKGKLYGKLHKAQCKDVEQFESLKEGQQIDCKILYVKKDKNLQIDLTTKAAHMNAASGLEESEVLPLEVEKFLEKAGGKKVLLNGIVKSVDSASIHPVYVELTNYHHGYLSAFDIDSKQLNSLKSSFKKGSVISCYVQNIDKSKAKEGEELKHIQLTLLQDNNTNSTVNLGDLCTVKVVKRNLNGLRVQISDNQFGSVDITEICDEWIANPTESIQINQYVQGRVIIQEANQAQITLRSSVVDKTNWAKALGPNGTTIEYKKLFGDSEKIGDLRNRILKLGTGSVKVGMIFVGYVNNTSEKGCFINIGQDAMVRAGVNELSDEHIAKPQNELPKNKLVVGRIIAVREDGKIEASLRNSVIKHGFSMDDSKLKAGVTVHGTVVGHYQGRASIQIRGCKYRASLDKDDTDFTDEEKMKYVEKLLPMGMQIKAKVTRYEKEPKVRIILSMEKKEFEKYGNAMEEEMEDEKEQNHLDLLIKSVAEINVVEEKTGENEIKLKKNYAMKEQEKEKMDEEEEEEEEDGEGDNDDEKEDLTEAEIQKLLGQGNDEEGDSDDDEDDNEEVDEDADDKAVDSGDEIEGDDDDDSDILSEQSLLDEELDNGEIVSEKKKSTRQKQVEKRRKEEEIRKQEFKLIDGDHQPESRDDFEKLILKNPNSSYIWIQFIAYVIEKEGIAQAREVTERALRVINFTNQQEKLNLYTAYMNLEHNFGDEKTLVKIFERAKAACKPKDVYFKLLEIYRREESQMNLLFQLSKSMVTKFKHSNKCWVEHLKNVIAFRESMVKQKLESKLNQSHDPKEVLKRALICLKKNKHIVLLSQYARLQYIHNQVETGRTTFEALLANYPKRTDIWSVYLDLEMKYGTVDSARNLFNRVITMQFKPRQMKFFFRKFLQFEASRGSSEGVEAVKQKAAEFVESLIGKNEDEEAPQKDSAIEVEGDDDNNNEGSEIDEELAASDDE